MLAALNAVSYHVGWMKSYRQELTFNIPTRLAFLNITSQVESALRRSSIQEGIVLVNAMHITCLRFHQ